MKSFVVTAVCGLAVSAAVAAPLLPGGSVQPVPVTPGWPSVAVSAVNSGVFTSPSLLYSGQLLSQVYTTPANPFGPNALTFVYLLQNNATSTNSLGRFSINGFTGFQTDVELYGPSAGVDAFEATRQADGSSLGATYLNLPGFGLVNPGSLTRILIVHTDATSYTLSTASVIDGDIAMTTAWAPLPTPGAGALLGLGTLAAFRRRR